MIARILVLTLTLLATPAPALADAINVANQGSAVGINLSRNRVFQSALPWVNALKMAEAWRESPSGSGCLGSNRAYTGSLDPDGYPLEMGDRSCIHTRMFGGRHEDSLWPVGEWVLRHSGSASFRVGGAATGLSVEGQRGTFQVGTSSGGLYLMMDELDPADPPRELRLYPPGGVCAASTSAPYDFEPWSYCSTERCAGGACEDARSCGGERPNCIDLEEAAEEGGLVFHPLWLSRLRHYRTLRMMDFMHTNHSRVEDFSHWMTEDYFSWGYGLHQPRDGGGNTPGNVPLEIVAKLCNTLNAECYVNVPHGASDANIREMARLFRDGVAPHLPVYMEYSNEVWNGIFGQHRYSYEAAAALPATEFDGADCLNRPSDCSDNFVGKRTFEMCRLAQTVFDENGMGDRLVCVLGRQVSDPTKLERSLDCPRWTAAPGGNCYAESDIDMVAIAPYFGDRDDCSTASSTTELCAMMESDIDQEYSLDSTDRRAFIRNQLASIRSRGLDWPLITYEGGSHQADAGAPQCQAAATDPCIRDVYMKALTDWKAHAASSAVHQYIFFDAHSTYSGNLFGARGSWYGETSAWPKEAGILDWSTLPANQCWWPGCRLGVPSLERPAAPLLLP